MGSHKSNVISEPADIFLPTHAFPYCRQIDRQVEANNAFQLILKTQKMVPKTSYLLRNGLIIRSQAFKVHVLLHMQYTRPSGE